MAETTEQAGAKLVSRLQGWRSWMGDYETMKLTGEDMSEILVAIATLIAERDRALAALDAMRATTIRQAAETARNACLVPPDGGSPTEAEAALCDEAAMRILALATSSEKAEQAKRCACHGSDDYCPCQNVPDRETQHARAVSSATRKGGSHD